VAPSFDLVRVQRGGQMVVAGRAAPGAQVELRAGGEVIDQVRADPRGQWVSVPLRRLPAGDQELTVAARSGDALPIESEQVVVLAVPGDEPASGRADHPAAAAVALETPGEEALAVLLPKDGRGEGRVLQAPGRIGSDGQLALLMLYYVETGQIRLSGEALVGEDGAWTCTLDRTLAPGSYTLRVDQLDPAGQPVARLETPFTRVAQPPVHGDALVDYVIVQPGNSLWRIARRLFGSGFEYVHIYEANHAQIRDPDLIYPGQVFEIPIGVAGG
jgi:nucleoid-associated protein YgaU